MRPLYPHSNCFLQYETDTPEVGSPASSKAAFGQGSFGRRSQKRIIMLILVRPHASIFDGPAVALWLARQRNIRNAVFAVDPDYARHPVKAPLLKMYGWVVGRHRMVAMDGRRPFALRRVLEDLAAGRSVVIFPQGTGLSDPKRPDQPGMGWLLRKIPSVPVVQLYLDHSSLWPSVTVQADHWFTIGKTRDAHVSAGI